MTITNKTVKITKKDRFNQLLAIPDVAMNNDLVAFIEHELELLNKKASGKKKNEVSDILLIALYNEFAEIDKAITVTEFLAQSTACETNGIQSSQKLAPILKKMKGLGMLINEVKSKKSYYKVDPSYETFTDELETE